MPVSKAQKGSVEVEFMKFDGRGLGNRDEVLCWAGKQLDTEVFSDSAYKAGAGVPWFSLIVPTTDGNMTAEPGDYIIKKPNGGLYVYKSDVFEKTYKVL